MSAGTTVPILGTLSLAENISEEERQRAALVF